MDSMDSFDEFEFTPITEGLGFHKKPSKLEKTAESFRAEMELPLSKPKHDFVLPQTNPEPKIRAPLPRPGDFAKPTAPAAPSFTMPKPATPKIAPQILEPELRPIGGSVAAALVDGILVIAFAIIFLVALLVVTKVDLMAVLANSQGDELTQASLVVLFVTVMQLYIVASRSFFGGTIGDWAFDIQLGKLEQQQRWSYPFKILWRSLVVTATGVLVLPFLSLVTGCDLASYLCGLRLYRRQ